MVDLPNDWMMIFKPLGKKQWWLYEFPPIVFCWWPVNPRVSVYLDLLGFLVIFGTHIRSMGID